MKIRNGFVSNSSSSSFVVALPHKPENVGDLYTMIFGDGDKKSLISDVYSGDSIDKIVTKERACDILWGDLQSPRATSEEQIRHELEVAFPYIPIEDDSRYYDSFNDGYTEADKKEFKELVAKECGPAFPSKKIMTPAEQEKYHIRQNKIWDIRSKFSYDKCKYILEKGTFIFTVTYGDDTTEGRQMEYGDIFENVPHIKINGH